MSGRDIALTILVAFVWALNFLTSAISLLEIPPFLFTALRFTLLALPLLPFLRRPAAGQWPRLLAICMIVGVLHFSLNFVALKLAGELSAPAIVMQSYVPMTALLAWWWLGERFAWRTGLAIATSFAGVLVLGFDPAVLAKPAAMLTMLFAALCLAVGTILMKGLRGMSMPSQQGWMALCSVPPLLAISAVVEPGAFATLREASLPAWFGALYAAYFSSLLGHGLYYLLVQRNPVAQVTPWLLLSPAIAVALGIMFWGDRPGPRLWIGGAMILGGVLVIALRALAKSRTRPSAEATARGAPADAAPVPPTQADKGV